jgi:hypothetical protein
VQAGAFSEGGGVVVDGSGVGADGVTQLATEAGGSDTGGEGRGGLGEGGGGQGEGDLELPSNLHGYCAFCSQW